VATTRIVRRVGRPVTESFVKEETREAILDAAEQLFAKFGQSATSFRDIALAANVNPALISYYFGTKRDLYEEVYKRRGKDLTDRWSELLDALEAKTAAPSVADIVRVYLAAQFEMKEKGAGGLAFFRMQTRLHSEPEEQAFMLRRDVYDNVGKRFITMLEKAAPHINEVDISWRFIFLVGVALYMTSDVDRLDDLSTNRFYAHDLNEALERAMQFCVAGMMAPSTPYETAQKPPLKPAAKTKGKTKVAKKPATAKAQ
jgi:AcrR family transcriptional regulator